MTQLLFSAAIGLLCVAYIWGICNYLLGAIDAFADDLLHGVAYLLAGPFWFCSTETHNRRYAWPFRFIFIALAFFVLATVIDHFPKAF